MNDREAAAIIQTLIPTLLEDGPDALVKYANSHDLPPALLEKLAQVANRLITLHHIETSPDRGSPVPIIDVPELVDNYAKGSVRKSASVKSFAPTHDVATIDLARMLMKEAGYSDIIKIAAAPDPLDAVLDLAGLVARLQAAHWEADTASHEHAVLGDLYSDMSGLLDRYTEVAMGHAGSRKLEPASIDFKPGADRRALVSEIKAAVAVLSRAARKADSEALLNIAAEMEETVVSSIYKLDNEPVKEAALDDATIEEAANVLYGEACLEREKSASDLLSLLSDRGLVLSVAAAEREAIAEGCAPDRVKCAFDWLCRIRKAASAERFDYAMPVRVRSISADTRLSRAASEFVLTNTTVGIARDVSSDLAKAAMVAEPPPKKDEDEFEPQDTSDAANANGNLTPATPGAAGTSSAPASVAPTGEQAHQQAEGVAARPADDKDKGKSEPKEKAEGKSESKGKDDGTSARDWAGLLLSPISGAADAVSTAADMTNNALTSLTGKDRQNKAQKHLDMSAEDIVRSIMIRRMVATDPILREANPKQVLDVYNSIAKLNPAVAGDPEQLRLALREAVSYGGLTLDSQKLLTDVRKTDEDATIKARDNTRDRYAVGGSTLPQLLKTQPSK